jgi:RNA polymerase sigma-70 factor (ECF subfamily)
LQANTVHIDELIEQCRKQNPNAQFEVYHRYSKAMYNVAMRIIKDEFYAEDVMQESFLKAFQRINQFRNDVTFGAWLKRIIVNQSIDFINKNNALKFEDNEISIYKIEDEIHDSEPDYNALKANEILQTIQKLKTNYSTILTLIFIEGYDNEEVCEILNISYANCRTLLSRAKESLRTELAKK